jgi:hypothetical protein
MGGFWPGLLGRKYEISFGVSEHLSVLKMVK